MKNILFILSSLLCIGVSAKDDFAFSEQKEIKKSFAANASFELEISNKHGDVSFETWSKDSVSIVVSIEVKSDKLEKVNELIDRITVRFSDHTEFISATTEWGAAGSAIKADIMKLLSNQSISVDYKIMLPEGMEVNVVNKFGDINFENYSGELKIDLVHGKFFGNNIKEAKLLKVSYGKIVVKKFEEADIVSKFSDVRIDEIDQLRIDAVSSDLEIENAKKTHIVASAGTVEIENAERVEIKGSFTEFEIENLAESLEGELKFGSLEIDRVSSSFSGIELKGASTDIDITFDSEIAFNYFIEMEKGKSFRIPTEGNSLNEQTEVDEIKSYEGLFATVPVGGKPANVSIRVKNSYVRLGLE